MRRAILALLAVAIATVVLVGAKHRPGVRPPPPPAAHRSGVVAAGVAARLLPGTYTGSVERTPHGKVQVRVVVVAGRIVDVTVLQIPLGGRSTEINRAVVPVLREEALAAQNAKIDTVSGATNTSRAYARSLQAALNAAAHVR